MDDKEKDTIVEHLKQVLLSHIAVNQKVNERFARIIRLLVVISVASLFTVISGIIIVVYLIVHTNISENNKYVADQRKYIENDRKDIAIARSTIVTIIKHYEAEGRRLDSLKKIYETKK